jgi:hypothetical protein
MQNLHESWFGLSDANHKTPMEVLPQFDWLSCWPGGWHGVSGDDTDARRVGDAK